MTDHLRLPPFGRILQAYQEQKVRLDYSIYIYVGKVAKDHAFADIKCGSIATFLPYGENGLLYRWPINEQRLAVIDTGGMAIFALKHFCCHLMSFNPRVIFLHSEEHPNELFLPQGRSYNG